MLLFIYNRPKIMSKKPLKGFEDLETWREGRKLAVMVYGFTSKGKFAKDFGLKEQIQRAAVSGGGLGVRHE